MVLPGEGWRGRQDLPDVRGERRPITYRRPQRWRERLVGLVPIVLGVCGLAGVLWLLQGGPLIELSGLKAFNPLFCLVPVLALGAVGLILLGLRRLFTP